jgi:hypothetical protein
MSKLCKYINRKDLILLKRDMYPVENYCLQIANTSFITEVFRQFVALTETTIENEAHRVNI